MNSPAASPLCSKPTDCQASRATARVQSRGQLYCRQLRYCYDLKDAARFAASSALLSFGEQNLCAAL